MVRAYLAAAGIEYDGPAGRFDFHALRVQYVTGLAWAGVEQTAGQKLARHSTPNLTSNVYSRVQPQLRDRADRLRL
jgi:hypothetical protein